MSYWIMHRMMWLICGTEVPVHRCSRSFSWGEDRTFYVKRHWSFFSAYQRINVLQAFLLKKSNRTNGFYLYFHHHTCINLSDTNGTCSNVDKRQSHCWDVESNRTRHTTEAGGFIPVGTACKCVTQSAWNKPRKRFIINNNNITLLILL